MLAEVWSLLRQWTPWEVKQYYWAAIDLYTSPWFIGGIVGILIWEKLQPAIPDQPMLSKGVAEDSVWLNIELASRAILIPPVAAGMTSFYNGVVGGGTVAYVAAWPTALKIVLSLLIFDFLEYSAHWLRHRSAFLWRFHAVHHSQRQLNLFSASRSHVFEYLVVTALVTAPMLAFGLTPFAIMGTTMGIGLQSRLVHANIRSNCGPLGLIFVNPQFHRMHHSIDSSHVNRNFGLILTLWDRVLGTAWNDRQCYPDTGVTGLDQTPDRLHPSDVARAVWSQLTYPFRRGG